MLKAIDLPNDYVSDENIKRRYNFGDFVYKTILGETYPTFTAVGWTEVKLRSSVWKYRRIFAILPKAI